MREPAFWWRRPGLVAGMFAPLAALYATLAAHRLKRPGHRVAVPVVCVGNPTLGGAGKTPLALLVARLLAAAGERPVLLSRGYGGRLAGPLQVDLVRHSAADVGDEPLLLAGVAPTIVARDRVAGAAAALAAGASLIVMDDGFQNPSLHKNFSVLVVDARRGIGNGKVIPAGPLRAPLDAQFALADALVIVGAPASDPFAMPAHGMPVFRGTLVPEARGVAELGNGRVLAFAGIGDPEKFFTTLRDAGIALAATQSFADHHRYTKAEATALCERAARENLVLLTTAKDAARLRGDPAVAALAAQAIEGPVTLVLDDEAGFMALMRDKIASARHGEPTRYWASIV